MKAPSAEDCSTISDALTSLYYAAPNRQTEIIAVVERSDGRYWIEGDDWEDE